MYLQKSLDQRKHNVDVIDVIIAAAENERAFELVTEFVSANIKIIYERWIML